MASHSFTLVLVLNNSSVEGDVTYPFRIIENYQTADGIRSRLMDGMWTNRTEAIAQYSRLCKTLPK